MVNLIGQKILNSYQQAKDLILGFLEEEWMQEPQSSQSDPNSNHSLIKDMLRSYKLLPKTIIDAVAAKKKSLSRSNLLKDFTVTIVVFLFKQGKLFIILLNQSRNSSVPKDKNRLSLTIMAINS